ncbi:hypothetical protein [Paracoccus versutus]
MLTMRFLLTFHCEATGQWRCLDTALLPAFRSGRAEDLPAALRAEPELVMRWLLGRYEIADALVPATTAAQTGQGDAIAVYPLGADRAVIGFENAYNGAWLEIFLLENRPIGFVAARKRQVLPAGGAMASLKIRAARPLHASDQACRLTVSRIIEHRQIWAEQRREGADPVAALTEES